jgi:hypothetical protein
MRENFKSFLANDRYFYACLVICVGVGAFALGRISVTEGVVRPVVQYQKAQISPAVSGVVSSEDSKETTAAAPLTPLAEEIVASKTGTRYHLPTCPGASQIKPENLVSFSSREAALAAGYTPAANCPGLK